MASKLVTFNADFYPYVYGDVVKVDTDELKRIDKVAKARGIDEPYTEGEHKVSRDTITTPTGDSEAELDRAREAEAEAGEEDVQEDPNQTTDEISEKGQAQQAKRTENLAKK